MAQQQDWSLAEVLRKAAEQFVSRFPENPDAPDVWQFPTLDCGGDFLTDPTHSHPETDTMIKRSKG